VALLYGGALALGVSEEAARAMGFSAVVMANVALIVGNRSRQASVRELLRPNAALWWIVCGALVALALTLYVPQVRDIFRFGTPTAVALAASAAPALIVLVVMLLVRALRSRRRR
jgi:Ca2+-transporting ATPase